MPAPNLVSGVGAAPLPDIGTLSYNGVTWSCLYRSKVNGVMVQDNAERTIKMTDYSFDIEGWVTLKPGDTSIDNTMTNLRNQLEAEGGQLTYTGKGFGSFAVNVPGGKFRDVKWGPVPKLLSFQPLGNSNSAFVHWQCTTRVAEIKEIGPPVMQFNYEANVEYDDDCYSKLSLKGTLEIAMTYNTISDGTIPDCVDNQRNQWLNIQIDLTKFRVTRRHFNFSRDKRTAEWEYGAEELPPMGLPAGATSARGLMSVRPLAGKGGRFVLPWNGMLWSVNLRGTYSIRADQPRRIAAEAFIALLWFRMQSAAANGGIPLIGNNNPDNQQPGAAAAVVAIGGPPAFAIGSSLIQKYYQLFQQNNAAQPAPQQANAVFLTHFGFDEGLYLDSKTATFEAGWVLATTFSNLLIATGAWRWANEADPRVWVQDVQPIMGSQSWLTNRLDNTVEVIVNLGTGQPLDGPPFKAE